MDRPSYVALFSAIMLIFGMTGFGQTKTLDTLYDFKGKVDGDGANPALLSADKSGALYGITGDGGNTCNCGTVFAVMPDGTESVLYKFCPAEGCYDGFGPTGSVAFDSSKNLYGTTTGGGGTDCNDNVGCGTVFELTRSGTESVLYSFKGGNDGAYPASGVVRGANGNLFGTTVGGGNNGCNSLGCGTVFEVSSGHMETILHVFQGRADGASPLANIAIDSAGNIYGTTAAGGSGECDFDYGAGCGTVFKVAADGSESILYAFEGGSDGAFPRSTLVIDGNGNLYGTTQLGGEVGCGSSGCGTVFKIAPNGAETVLYRFSGYRGAYPDAGLAADKSGNFFGTVSSGGKFNYGAVFELDADRKETLLYSFTNKTDGQSPQSGLIFGKHHTLYGTTFYGGNSQCLCGTVFEIGK